MTAQPQQSPGGAGLSQPQLLAQHQMGAHPLLRTNQTQNSARSHPVHASSWGNPAPSPSPDPGGGSGTGADGLRDLRMQLGSFHPDLSLQRVQIQGAGMDPCPGFVFWMSKTTRGTWKSQAITALPSLEPDLLQRAPDPCQGSREALLCAHCHRGHNHSCLLQSRHHS